MKYRVIASDHSVANPESTSWVTAFYTKSNAEIFAREISVALSWSAAGVQFFLWDGVSVTTYRDGAPI